MEVQATARTAAAREGKRRRRNWKPEWPLHLMLLPSLLFVIVFSYIPMAGVVIAFQDFKPWLGLWNSPWVGLDQFKLMMNRPDSIQVIWNTFLIAGMKIVSSLIASIVFALLLNEVRHRLFKKAAQTLVYLPHFLSWVVLGGILREILAYGGMLNRFCQWLFGIDGIPFLSNGIWFRATVVVSEIWKEFGFGTIVFLAAIAAVNPSLYEAAEMDGAGRMKQTWYVTIPAMLPIIVLVMTLSLGNVLNAGFDQIFNLYSPLVYDKGDIIDTFVYRTGILGGNMGFGAAVGLFKSVIGCVLIIISYRLAYKLANYRIF